MQESQAHRLQCGPLRINFGASPMRPAAGAPPAASAPGMRARGGQKRSACFGFAEADDEEALRSAAEQRYLKVLLLCSILGLKRPFQAARDAPSSPHFCIHMRVLEAC